MGSFESRVREILTKPNFVSSRVLFVGFPGSGTATAMITFALRYKDLNRKSIRIENRDFYHIGKDAQLKVLSHIIGCEYFAVENVSEFPSYKEEVCFSYLPGLKKLDEIPTLKELAESNKSEICIVIDCSRYFELNQGVLDIARKAKIKNVIFTKIDLVNKGIDAENQILNCEMNIIMATNGEDIPSNSLIRDS